MPGQGLLFFRAFQSDRIEIFGEILKDMETISIDDGFWTVRQEDRAKRFRHIDGNICIRSNLQKIHQETAVKRIIVGIWQVLQR